MTPIEDKTFKAWLDGEALREIWWKHIMNCPKCPMPTDQDFSGDSHSSLCGIAVKIARQFWSLRKIEDEDRPVWCLPGAP